MRSNDQKRADINQPLVISQSSAKGGAENYLLRLYGELRTHGYEASLLGNIDGWDKSKLPKHEESLGPKWSRRTILRGALRLPLERQMVKRVLTRLNPSWVHLQFKREQIAFSQAAARFGPVVWTEHGQLPLDILHYPLMAGYARAARHASRIICVSEEVEESVKRVVGSSAPTVVIENSVDGGRFNPGSAETRSESKTLLKLVPNKLTLLWVGRVDKSKLPHLAVRLAAALDVNVVVAGSGSELESLREAAKTQPNLFVLGHIEDTRPLYLAADVMIFTSTGASEGYPTTTMAEATAARIPIVTHPESGAGRAVFESGGRVVSGLNDIESWKSELQAAVFDPLAAVRQSWLSKHSLQSWVDRHVDVLESLS